MPKAPRPSQAQGQYRTNPLAIQQQQQTQNRALAAQHLQNPHLQQHFQQQAIHQQSYYPAVAVAMQNGMNHQNGMMHPSQLAHPAFPSSYISGNNHSSYSQLQQPSPPSYTLPAPTPSMPPTLSNRPSSGAWTPSDDSTLLSARQSGQNWGQIQSQFFPGKTANACRKRHERLMDKRNSDDGDVVKLEALGQAYMSMRKEIWAPLAERTGEKWSVVETKVLGMGYKNLQSLARSATRRARLSGSHSYDAYNPHSSDVTDDSGIAFEGDEDDEAEYSTRQLQQPSPPGTDGSGGSYHDGGSIGGGGHSRVSSISQANGGMGLPMMSSGQGGRQWSGGEMSGDMGVPMMAQRGYQDQYIVRQHGRSMGIGNLINERHH